MHEAQLREILEQEDAQPTISAKQFLLKTLLWLPVCFIGWYWAAALFSFPAILLSDLLLPLILPGVMVGVEQQVYLVDYCHSAQCTSYPQSGRPICL